MVDAVVTLLKVACYHISFPCFQFEQHAGESHGECLVATMAGLPAGIPVSLGAVDRELWRRQQGYGRGGRMKIETDRARIVSGVRHSITIGSPIALIVENKDWKNWESILPVEATAAGGDNVSKPVTRPRPGHADLAGAIKYNFHDAVRYILERCASAHAKPRRGSRTGRVGESIPGAEFRIRC